MPADSDRPRPGQTGPWRLRLRFDFTFYDDELASGWQDNSWNTTRDFNNSEPVHSGLASIAITYTAGWGGLLLHNDSALPVVDYTAIRFWVHGGSTGGQSVNFHVKDGGESYLFIVQANTWVQVTVPLAALGNPTTLSDLFWQDNSGGSQPTFYLDDISLIETSLGTWTTVPSPVSYPLTSVAMLSANDGWAVGYEGTYPNGDLQGSVNLRWNGNMWTIRWADASGFPLSSVEMVSASDGWIVGNSTSRMYRWDGSTWNDEEYPASSHGLKSVAMVSADNGWAVGGGGMCGPGGGFLTGTILRWDGSTWSWFGTLPDIVLTSVSMVSSNDGWAVGWYCHFVDIAHQTWDSVILHWNGSNWNVTSSPTNAALYSVAMLSATDGWAVGEVGTILHWNGSSWSLVSGPNSCKLRSVAMVSAGNGWVVGGDNSCSQPSVILHWDGGSWSEVDSPVSQTLNSVTMISANEGWAVGEAGTILHYIDTKNLSIIKNGDGSGKVTSNPAGIDCGGTCSAAFDHNISVTLTATAVSGWTFAGWNGSGCSGEGTCTVYMNVSKSVKADFTQSCYSLIRTHTGSGSDPTASPANSTGCSSGQYHAGEAISLSASPAANWSVGSWSGTNNDATTSHNEQPDHAGERPDGDGQLY